MPRAPVAAARKIQELWRERREELSHAFGAEAATIGVGIGLDTGSVNFGEFGRTHHDLTAIGTVVNVASRAQSAAAADQILITAAVREKAAATLPENAARDYQLKGIDAPRKALGGLRRPADARFGNSMRGLPRGARWRRFAIRRIFEAEGRVRRAKPTSVF